MICQRCNQETPDGSTYCNRCGAPVAREARVKNQPEKKGGGYSKRGLSIFILICLAAFATPFILKQLTMTSQNTSTSSPIGAIAKAVQQVRSIPIAARQEFDIPPRGYRWFKFSTNMMPAPVVNGQFMARGGSGNDINVIITDAAGFQNFQNGNGATLWYSAYHQTAGNIEAHLPTGSNDYYLIFDNRMSIISTKHVGVEASLTFIQ